MSHKAAHLLVLLPAFERCDDVLIGLGGNGDRLDDFGRWGRSFEDPLILMRVGVFAAATAGTTGTATAAAAAAAATAAAAASSTSASTSTSASASKAKEGECLSGFFTSSQSQSCQSRPLLLNKHTD